MSMRLWVNSTTDIGWRALHGHHYQIESVATTSRRNHCRPSAVSHNQDSGWLLRRSMACVRRCTLLLDRPICRAMRRTLWVVLSQRQLKIRKLLSQNLMSVGSLKDDGTLGGIQFLSVPDRHLIVPP